MHPLELRRNYHIGPSAAMGITFGIFGIVFVYAAFLVKTTKDPADEDSLNPGVFVFGAVFFLLLAVVYVIRCLHGFSKSLNTPLVATIDIHGVTLHEEQRMIAWSDVQEIVDDFTKQRGVISGAKLRLRMKSGVHSVLDLSSVSGNPARTARAIRDFYRASSGIDLHRVFKTAEEVTCPLCHKKTNAIRSIQSSQLTCLLIFPPTYETRIVIGCRKCLRAHLGNDATRNLLTANLLFPHYLLIVIIPQLIKLAFGKGHNEKALDLIVQRPDDE